MGFSKVLMIHLCLVICLNSCKNNAHIDDGQTFYNDLEKIKCWASPGINNVQGITTIDNAHSGRFVSKTDTINRYSYIFMGSFRDISNHPLKKAKISIWVKSTTQNIKGSLVLSIDSAGKSIRWVGIDLEKYVKTANDWTEIKTEYTFVKLDNYPDKVFAFYIWNTGNGIIYSDDYKVTFIDQ